MRVYTVRTRISQKDWKSQKKFNSERWRKGKSRSDAVWKRKYMSFRSTAHACRNTNTNICRWHIASIVVTPENGAKHGSSRSLLSSALVPRPISNGSPTLYLPPPPRELPFHWQPLLRKSSPFGFKWGLVHTMPRVIYPLRHSRQFDSSDEGERHIAIRPLTLGILSLSVPRRSASESILISHFREMIKRQGASRRIKRRSSARNEHRLENVILIIKILNVGFK